MTDNAQKIETMRKRLLWRAMHRGIKEMDIIVGGFATVHLAGMSEQTLDEFAEILELPDQNLLSWVTHQEAVPEHLSSPLLLDMLAYRPDNLK
jgi:antitoxin CptB